MYQVRLLGVGAVLRILSTQLHEQKPPVAFVHRIDNSFMFI